MASDWAHEGLQSPPDRKERKGLKEADFALGPRPGSMKQTGFPKGEPDPLYRRDSPWISSYHIQNSFQLNITDITHVYNITWVYLLHNPKDCNTNLRVQAPWAKRKQTESGNDI